MTTAVGLERGIGYIPLPVATGNNGLRITVSTTPTIVNLASTTEVVFVSATNVRVFVGLGTTVGTGSGQFACVVDVGTGRYLAVPRGATLALMTDGGTEDIVVEQY